MNHLDELEGEIQSIFMEVLYVCQMNFFMEPFSAETDDAEELLDLQHTLEAETFL